MGATRRTRGWRVLEVLPEAQQRGERRPVRNFLVNRYVLIADGDAVDAVGRAFVSEARPGDHLPPRRRVAPER
jgi:hypothetical protein